MTFSSGVIWKFPLKMEAVQEIEMPPVYRFLHVAQQGNGLALWAQVQNVSYERSKHRIYIVGTGQDDMPDQPANYLGSVLMDDSFFVWHVFTDGGPQILPFTGHAHGGQTTLAKPSG